MKYTAVVEIPKGSDRRIHMAYDGSGFIDLGLIKDRIPVHDGIMPVAYGYLPNYINHEEKDNVDVLIFSRNEFKTGDEVEVEVFGIVIREDEDHKVLARDTSFSVGSFNELDDKQLLLDYFGFKSKISSVEDKEWTESYLKACFASE